MKKSFKILLFVMAFLLVALPRVNAAGIWRDQIVGGPDNGWCVGHEKYYWDDGSTTEVCPSLTYDGHVSFCIEKRVVGLGANGQTCEGLGGTVVSRPDLACAWFQNQTSGYFSTQAHIWGAIDNGYPTSSCADTNCSTAGTVNMVVAGADAEDKLLLKLSSDGQYYLSNEITISYANIPSNNYKIELVDGGFLPTGTEIVVSGTDTVIPDGSTATAPKVRVRIPVAGVTKSVKFSLKVTVDFVQTCTTRTPYGNACVGRSGQDMAWFWEDTSTATNNVSKPVSVNFEIKTGDFLIIKKDGKSGSVLAGVKFKLYTDAANTKEAKTADGKPIEIVTKANGAFEIKNVVYGTYYLVETESLINYEIITTPEIIVIDKPSGTLTIQNVPIEITISKTDITGAKELPGALIKIIDEVTGLVMFEFTSTDQPTVLHIAAGSYILEEMIAPDGYMVMKNQVFFSIDAKGKLTITTEKNPHLDYDEATKTFIIKNEENYVEISKKDVASGEELEGATIVVTCEDGFVKEWISTDTPEKFTIKPNVVCKLKETIAPEGYDVIETELEFKVLGNGDVQVIGTPNGAYSILGNKIVVYNGNIDIPDVPDTGIYVWIGTAIGVALLGAGAYFFFYKKKKATV